MEIWDVQLLASTIKISALKKKSNRMGGGQRVELHLEVDFELLKKQGSLNHNV